VPDPRGFESRESGEVKAMGRRRAIKVVVADDDDDFRQALVEVLDADPRFEVVGAAASGDEMVDIALESRPDLVVIDVRMPSGGPEAARNLREAAARSGMPTPAIVALTAQPAVTTVVAMLRAGARSYLAKGRVDLDLPELLARVTGGEVVLTVPVGAEALSQLIGSDQ
jgi:DNA-binding NarL/FixJ family response regulator